MSKQSKISTQPLQEVAGWIKRIFRRRLRLGVFVLGTPHSGTSLLTAMLDSHRNMSAIDKETGVFFIAPKRIRQALESFDDFARTKGVRRWVEKTPDHILHWNTLRRHCPHNVVLLTVRDGRDVVASLKARFESFEKALDVWERSALLTADLLGHAPDIAKTNRGPVAVVRYEELVSSPETVLRHVCKQIGEPFDPAMLIFHQQKRTWYSQSTERPPDVTQKNHAANRNWQINQPLYSGSGRWKTDLTTDEAQQMRSPRYTQLLQKLGYYWEDKDG